MSRTRQQAIADAIAKKIMANSKRRFSGMYADALQEIQMSDTVKTAVDDARASMTNGLAKDSSSSMSTGSQVIVGPIKQTDHLALEGTFKGEHRQQAAQVNPLAGNDTAPRAETTDQENAGA